MRLKCDFQLIITQIALRRQQCHLFAIIHSPLNTDLSSVAAVGVSAFYGGINVTFMPLLFTPVVCENVSRGDLSRHLPGGQFTLRTGALAGLSFSHCCGWGLCVSPPLVQLWLPHCVALPSSWAAVLLEQRRLYKPNEAWASQVMHLRSNSWLDVSQSLLSSWSPLF